MSWVEGSSRGVPVVRADRGVSLLPSDRVHPDVVDDDDDDAEEDGEDEEEEAAEEEEEKEEEEEEEKEEEDEEGDGKGEDRRIRTSVKAGSSLSLDSWLARFKISLGPRARFGRTATSLCGS